MSGRINRSQIPWWEDSTEAELEAWYQENPESFKEYLSAKWGEWNEIQQAMKPGQPHPLSYRQGESDPQYVVDINIFINQQAVEQGQEAVMERHKPAPQRGPVDRDFLALSSRDKKDRETGAEILRHRQFIDEQLGKAVQYRAMGEEAKAREAEARAGMMTREIQTTRKSHTYTFVEEADQRHVEDATNKLERALSLTPEEIEANREFYQGLISAFNATSDGNSSYLIDGPSAFDPNRKGESKIIKIEHDGLKACDVTRLSEDTGQSHLDTLIRSGYGRTNPKAEEEALEEETLSPQAWEQSLKPIE